MAAISPAPIATRCEAAIFPKVTGKNMKFLRIYELTAMDGCQDEMRSALGSLARAVREFDGCQSVGIAQDSDQPARLISIEKMDRPRGVGG